MTLGSYAGFLEVAFHGLRGVLRFLLFETDLHSLVAVFVGCLQLGNYTRANFDNSARQILAVGTENGCHSDFLSN